jgi:uncharacterized OB-fold protein
MADGPPIRLLPRLDATNRFFWESGADGRLRFLRCPSCKRFAHPPVPRCPYCLSAGLLPEAVSGRGTLHSFTVNHQQWIPGSEPYVVALVEIDEQPDVRLTSNLVGCEPSDAYVGMPVEVVFEHVEDVWLPLFRPGEGASGQSTRGQSSEGQPSGGQSSKEGTSAR